MMMDVIATLENYENISRKEHLDPDTEFDRIRQEFAKETQERETQIQKTEDAMNNAFIFMEQAFGESQEMVIFVTELNINYYSVWFIRENGCDKYYQYNKGLLFDEQQEAILSELDDIEHSIS